MLGPESHMGPEPLKPELHIQVRFSGEQAASEYGIASVLPDVSSCQTSCFWDCGKLFSQIHAEKPARLQHPSSNCALIWQR